MARSRGRRRKKVRQPGVYRLSLPDSQSLGVADAKASDLRAFVAAYQAALESQRIEHRDAIARSLLEVCRPFVFKCWQRKVSSKYSLWPLSARGSAIYGIGGRFNVGRIDPDRYPSFAALYLAADQDTALQEALGDIQPRRGMTFRELALKSVDSYAMYSLSGQIDCVLDITEPRALQPFIEVTRNFRVPKKIAQWAKTFSQSPLGVVQSVEELEQFLMLYDWRKIPLLLGVLSHSNNSVETPVRQASKRFDICPSSPTNPAWPSSPKTWRTPIPTSNWTIPPLRNTRP
jgi:RES domain-containing protein